MPRTGFSMLPLMALLPMALLVPPAWGGSARGDDAARFNLPLAQAEKNGIVLSERIKASEAEWEASRERTKSQYALLWPRLMLDASYRYVSQVPALTFPMGQQLVLGANSNYSIGPVIAWTLWDGGGLYKGWKSLQDIENSRQADLRNVRTQTLLGVRNAYFRVQLSLEQMRLVADSLKLVQAQYQDIERRYQAGASSRIDSLSAHREALNYRLQFRQTQTDLSSALRELMALVLPISEQESYDLTAPLESSVAADPPEGVGQPTLVVGLDPLEKSIESMRSARTGGLHPPGMTHPQVEALAFLGESSRKAAESTAAGLWPKVQVSAKTSLDYPNGPVVEQVYQNTVSVALSMPLFEMSRTRHEAEDKRLQAEAAERRKEQTRLDLLRDWNRGRDQLSAAVAQLEIARYAAEEARELSSMVYASYRAGRSSFIEVQSANLRLLEAKVQVARNQVQIMNQLATLDSLSGEQ